MKAKLGVLIHVNNNVGSHQFRLQGYLGHLASIAVETGRLNKENLKKRDYWYFHILFTNTSKRAFRDGVNCF